MCLCKTEIGMKWMSGGRDGSVCAFIVRVLGVCVVGQVGIICRCGGLG